MSKKSMSKLTHIRLNPRSNTTSSNDTHLDDIKDEMSTATSQSSDNSTKKVKDSAEDTSVDSYMDSKVKMNSDDLSGTSVAGVETEKSSHSLPQFLSRLQNSTLNPLSTNSRVPENRALAIVGEKTGSVKSPHNPNSFSSIFNKDHQEITGIQRVFKKSIAFMLLNLVSFGALALAGVNLIGTPVFLTFAIVIAYLVTANIFYVIVADRSYVWLGICSNMLLLLLVQSFLGKGFTPITLVVALLIGLLTYTSYSELEKIQLGSRLFSVSHIIGETTRILGTVVMLVLCLGVFNTALSETSVGYVDRVFLQNELIFDDIIMPGISTRINLNQLLINNSESYGVGNQTFTLSDFLEDNYIGTLVTETEESNIINDCLIAKSEADCDDAVEAEKLTKLLAFRNENYSDLNMDLDTVLKGPEYERVVKSHYKFLIRDFEKETIDNPFILIPLNHIIPAILAIGLYIILLVIKPIFGVSAQIITWILWSILKYVGFVRIEVENVEAEVVSI